MILGCSNVGVSIGIMILDKVVKDFLLCNSSSLIINLGAELDKRVGHLKNCNFYH